MEILNHDLDAKPITYHNVLYYIRESYGVTSTPQKKASRKLEKFQLLLQNDYGQPLDCAVTSVTACVNYLAPGAHTPDEIYAHAERIAKQFGYNGVTHGTYSATIHPIYKRLAEMYTIKKSFHSRVIKNLGVTFSKISSVIDSGYPVLLSIYKDGRNYYKDHTITVIGYELYYHDGVEYPFLVVADNWSSEMRYLDFRRLSLICSIDY